MEPLLFGQILRNFQLVEEDDLQRCLEIQRHARPHKQLGKILVEEGMIDAAMLASILTVQKRELTVEMDSLGMTSQELSERLSTYTGQDYLTLAQDLGASDLYLTAGKRPMVRLHGKLSDLPTGELTPHACEQLIYPFLTNDQQADYQLEGRLDVCTSIEGIGRFRLNLFRHNDGLGAVIRVLARNVEDFERLGLPETVRKLTQLRQGLILVTGTTGSGKTTTLGAMVNEINKTQNRHIITLEDPIEMIFESDRSLITQREVGEHTGSYDDGLQAALREDPDVIVVGELRDPETFSVALTAAETGHLVIGTLHTRSAQGTILRVIDQFPANQREQIRSMLAGTLRAVICQELIPTVQGDDRVLAAEVMLVNNAIANLIRENRCWQIPNVMQTHANRGMQLLGDALDDLLKRELITVEEALNRCHEKSRFLEPTR